MASAHPGPLARPGTPEPAAQEARRWIEQVTGKSFGDVDFRTALENGVLLCELLNAIKPGLVKKTNKLAAPIAGLDNIILFLRGCREVGLKESQLFDPGDLQDPASRLTVTNSDCSRKLKNVLVTIYWLGKAAGNSPTFGGAALDLKLFEGLLAQEAEGPDSPRRSVRDSGYVDCWESECSDSLSPPRHARDDSFDSLDSFGSRAQQTPSPDVVLRGSSDGRGSDSEPDLPRRKVPDVRKDDMSARRVAHGGEPKSAVPFNQYLPNKSNQTAYVPAPLRRRRAEREELRRSWTTAAAVPRGTERPFSPPETIAEEPTEGGQADREISATTEAFVRSQGNTSGGSALPPEGEHRVPASGPQGEESEGAGKLRRLRKAGIEVLPAARRFCSPKPVGAGPDTTDTVLRGASPTGLLQGAGHGVHVAPDPERDDFAIRRMSRGSRGNGPANSRQTSLGEPTQGQPEPRSGKLLGGPAVGAAGPRERSPEREPDGAEARLGPDLQRDDMAQRKGQRQCRRLPWSFVPASAQITAADQETWDRLQVSAETSAAAPQSPTPDIPKAVALRDDFARRRAGTRASAKAPGPTRACLFSGLLADTDRDGWWRLSPSQDGPSGSDVGREAGGHSAGRAQTGPGGPIFPQHSQDPASSLEKSRYSPGAAGPADAESRSMLDVRSEEAAAATAVQPHSRAHQEQLQQMNAQLKEEDDQWQDDLARWKSRRRSASQDLIKKEAERKKMEKLLAEGNRTSERRKSIKTYREIVQEKERREKELHEAYKNAGSHEEAEGILQQYIERFTVSEAVLEHLHLPHILERSRSTEPGLSPFPSPLPSPSFSPSSSPCSPLLEDPRPWKYLRQQSLPPPRFTTTVQATVAAPGTPSTTGAPRSPSGAAGAGVMSALTPRPYAPRPYTPQLALQTCKEEPKPSLGGGAINGVEEEKPECPEERPCPPLTVSQPPAASPRDPTLVPEISAERPHPPLTVPQPPATPQGNPTPAPEISAERPDSREAPLEPTVATTREVKPSGQEDETGWGPAGRPTAKPNSPERQHFVTTVTCTSPTVASVEFSAHRQPRDATTAVGRQDAARGPDSEACGQVQLVLSQKAAAPKSPEPEASLVFPSSPRAPGTPQLTLPDLDLHAAEPSGDEKSPRFSFGPWDPEEERRRQECWQQEQERRLQERYQKEQDRLKEEWERAQREVEEEEQRYYEEERRIIEDTVVPLSVSSNSADQLSSSSSMATEGPGAGDKAVPGNWPEEEQEGEARGRRQQQRAELLPSDGAAESGSRERRVTTGTSSPGLQTPLPTESLQEPSPTLMERASPGPMPLPPEATRTLPPATTGKQEGAVLEMGVNHQPNTPGEVRRRNPGERLRAGLPSPNSPTPPGQSPSRSVSGKKLCSACGLPLGKGAAMIIDTLHLYFHLHCFRCGVCRGQLGDAAQGTDVRIRNGLLTCNDCYIRSRSAGQPTTL
ncbi:LIM and calponin homology domains-containing protein 1 isoform X3 [Tachyglossus aculeatus]|uniref:LIM and calponin homology domains-containing protein 1 isoform X3 n=1 Tax=Tachyglossus aculeatus TaxID=9261 RepID=UPI0018F6E963|nr:LIM and calponin homology domains-containing protein 1 isoform X3 [Tachyglossus aculeatus]